MEIFQVRPLSESDLNFAFQSIGGNRAHLDADRRPNVGADYSLGRSIVELKCLDEEGFNKASRQEKLANLFQEYEPERPVIVIDRRILQPKGKIRFDRIIEGPIKTAVAKASRQLKQSRTESKEAKCSVLMIVNNGYTAIDHDTLKALVVRRVRQDTSGIDAVVIAGAYYHSDGFDGVFLWPIDCVPINLKQKFAEYEQLRAGWHNLAQDFMTRLMQGDFSGNLNKGPVADTQFDWDGVTYIRPAPIFGVESKFYVYGRPRKDSSGLTSCPPVGLTYPALSRSDWLHVKERTANPSEMFDSFEAWKNYEAQGQAEGTLLCPFVPVPVTAREWENWCKGREDNGSVFDYANERFCQKVQFIAANARSLDAAKIVPSTYILVSTDIIGQDKANDVSHITSVRQRLAQQPLMREIVANARIKHEYAISVGASYAVRDGIDLVMYSKNNEYAWI